MSTYEMIDKELNERPFGFVLSPSTAEFRTLFVYIVCVLSIIPFLSASYQPVIVGCMYYPFIWVMGWWSVASSTKSRADVWISLLTSVFALGWGVFLIVVLLQYQDQNPHNWSGEYTFNGIGGNTILNVTSKGSLPSDGLFTMTVAIVVLLTFYSFLEFVYGVAYIVLSNDWDKIEKDKGITKDIPETYYRSTYFKSTYGSIVFVLGLIVYCLSVSQWLVNLIYFCMSVPIPVGPYYNSTLAVFVAIVITSLPIPRGPKNTREEATQIIVEGERAPYHLYDEDSLEGRLESVPMDTNENELYLTLVKMYSVYSVMAVLFGGWNITSNSYWISQNGADIWNQESLRTLFEGDINLAFTNVEKISIAGNSFIPGDMAFLTVFNNVVDMLMTILAFFMMLGLFWYIVLANRLKTKETLVKY